MNCLLRSVPFSGSSNSFVLPNLNFFRAQFNNDESFTLICFHVFIFHSHSVYFLLPPPKKKEICTNTIQPMSRRTVYKHNGRQAANSLHSCPNLERGEGEGRITKYIIMSILIIIIIFFSTSSIFSYPLNSLSTSRLNRLFLPASQPASRSLSLSLFLSFFVVFSFWFASRFVRLSLPSARLISIPPQAQQETGPQTDRQTDGALAFLESRLFSDESGGLSSLVCCGGGGCCCGRPACALGMNCVHRFSLLSEFFLSG